MSEVEAPLEYDNYSEYFFDENSMVDKPTEDNWLWGIAVWTKDDRDIQRVYFANDNILEEDSPGPGPNQEALVDEIIKREHKLLAQGIPEKTVHAMLQREFGDFDVSDMTEEVWKKNQNPDHADKNSTGYKKTHYETPASITDSIDSSIPIYMEDHKVGEVTGPGTREDDHYLELKPEQPFQDIREDDTQSFNFETEIAPEDSMSPSSTVIAKAEYFPKEQTMMIYINGNQYPYYNVPYRLWDSFKGAQSKGAAYNRLFKGQTQFFSPNKSVNQESIQILAHEWKEALVLESKEDFSWIDEEAINNMLTRSKMGDGKFLLIRAAQPAVTDHRSEGEKYRRWVTEDVLKKLTYTAIGKSRDINHYYPVKDFNGGVVVDAEWNDKTKTAEFVVFETDQEILDAIKKGIITAVSINGSKARKEIIVDGSGKPITNEIQCSTGDCFRKGEGIVLGERDNIAFTYVVTQPGWFYNGMKIIATKPGIKTTKIHILE